MMFESWFDIKNQSFYPIVLNDGFIDAIQVSIENRNYWKWMNFIPIYGVLIAEKEWIHVEKFKPFMFISFDYDWIGKESTTHFPELISLS